MSTIILNLLSEEVTNSTLGNILISSSISEHTVIPWDSLNAVNNIVCDASLLVIDALHDLSLLIKKFLILFLCIPDCWHGIVIELAFLLSRSFDIDDSDFTLDRGNKNLITIRHKFYRHEYLAEILIRVNGRL